jgi:D-glycero-D-manno-heptose 1,7-bisphosphate phosphatase
MKRVIFLDRDGVINVDHGYVSKKENFEFCEGVFDALRDFSDKGYSLVIVTNQSGIARGYYSEEDFQKLTEWMLNELLSNSITIDSLYYCPHHPEDKCDCRKPNIGMIKKACEDFDIDLEKSWMIGDKSSDIELAKNANIANSILVSDSLETHEADYLVNSLKGAIDIIK